MGWYQVMAQILDRAPLCDDCEEPTTLVGEALIHAMPPVLEARYRCSYCSRDVVRREVPDLWE